LSIACVFNYTSLGRIFDPDAFLGEMVSLLAEIELSRIVFVNSIKGFSNDQIPHNRYTVGTDPEVGW